VARFALGFLVASLLWAGALAGLHLELGWGPPPPADEAPIEIAATETAIDDEAPASRRGRRRRASGGSTSASSGADLTGEATSGDDLREGEMRTIDGEGTGGEEQLTGAQIDGAFDAALGRIRRCFILAPGDEPITGTLTFGLRVAGTGRATAVNLTGPRGLTTGEPGDCLRDVARGMTFPTFDGPEMVVRYPISLE
jgi:hypothetical protein